MGNPEAWDKNKERAKRGYGSYEHCPAQARCQQRETKTKSNSAFRSGTPK
jgi:hypothetical protein